MNLYIDAFRFAKSYSARFKTESVSKRPDQLELTN